jgi:hypothetical protein
MLLEAREMQAGQDKIQEELKEVEEELDAAEGNIPLRNMEQGRPRSFPQFLLMLTISAR